MCCFTYDPNIPIEHWKEYSSKGDGVLFSVKQDWFKKEVKLMTEDNKSIDNKVFKSEPDMIKNNPQTPLGSYFIRSFDFFEVVYDDYLKHNISNKGFINFYGKKVFTNIILPGIAGNIKKKQGICNRGSRKSYLKNWTTEKEVSLKVVIENKVIDKHNFVFRRIAVPLNDNAFDDFKIKFSESVSLNRKKEFINQLKTILPDSKIEEM